MATGVLAGKPAMSNGMFLPPKSVVFAMWSLGRLASVRYAWLTQPPVVAAETDRLRGADAVADLEFGRGRVAGRGGVEVQALNIALTGRREDVVPGDAVDDTGNPVDGEVGALG